MCCSIVHSAALRERSTARQSFRLIVACLLNFHGSFFLVSSFNPLPIQPIHHRSRSAMFVPRINRDHVAIVSWHPSSTTTTTALEGIRSALRTQLLRFNRIGSKPKTSDPQRLNVPSVINENSEPLSFPESEIQAQSAVSEKERSSGTALTTSRMPSLSAYVAGTEEVAPLSNEGASTAVLLAPPEPVVAAGTMGLYSLPPVPKDRRLSKLEAEFRDMLAHFTNYSEADLLSLRDPRMRTLFRGVAASAVEPPLYRAFEVLFEDLYPLRLAGRVVYKMLCELMVKSQAEREQEVAYVVNETGLSPDDAEATRLSFVSVAAEMNGDAFLTPTQLLRIPVLTDVALNILEFESVDQLLRRLEQHSHVASGKDSKYYQHHPHGKLTFTDIVVGLQKCAEEMCGVEACNPADVMQRIMWDLKQYPPTADPTAMDEKRQRFSERYDEMLSQFMEWEDVMPEGEASSRRMDVVRGCFIGARNPPVVDALRVVYVDYSPFRVAGDIIFKLVSGVMRARQQRHSH